MRRTLLSTVVIPVSPFQRQRLERIDAEDFGPVVRKTREELAKQGITLTTADAEEGVLALKQYYAVALLDPLNRHAVSDVIDTFWHAHILHTKQYVAFCHDIVGNYIHHEPLDHADTAKVREVASLYAYTAQVYATMFSYVNREFYPRQMPDIRMVCLHQQVTNGEVRSHARFPAVPIAA
jgi:hypothetical protein